MVKPKTQYILPNSTELADSDDLPVDNELQTLIPNLLSAILGFLWGNRFDWFFGINMGVYHTTGINPRVPIVPDAFLCLNVERVRGENLRRSYVVWEENDVVPILTLEVVSQTPGGEYDEKMVKYGNLGVLYYIIYNPNFWQRDRREPFEVYRLESGKYMRQLGEPLWMEEIGLGIGRSQGIYRGLEREWLYWFDERGKRLVTPEEEVESLQQQLARYREKFGEL